MFLSRIPFIVRKYAPDLCWRIPADKRNVLYLTFDDGPTPEITLWVLAELKKYNAKATFFCIGNNIDLHPEIFDAILEGGHQVGNHTQQHEKGWQTENQKYFNSVAECQEKTKNNLFRPPYGRIKKSQIKYLKKQFKIVMWTVLSGDYMKKRTGEACAKAVINSSKSGDIIVFHDSVKADKNLKIALPLVLEHFAKQFFTFESIEAKMN
ncbi:MAG: peptidoglycan/xylan/chitin deacetylase (PgdA/CDA1 family) [Flavobacteriales bacterium]|jgi:peptidoglycan/xylan/chitin deacetylase (PgdA/CDA1 family)